MALSGMVVAAVRSGITARLAASPATAAEVAADLGLDPLPTRLLLDCLRSTGHVAWRSGRYRLSRSASRWLDPASPLSVAGYVALGQCLSPAPRRIEQHSHAAACELCAVFARE